MNTRLLTLTLVLALIITAPIIASNVNVDEPAVCLVCHAEMEQLMTDKHQHTAFASGVCSDCHNPHASSHAQLLTNDLKDLCLNCHENIAGQLAMSSVHQPASDGLCLACHDPHASNYKNQLSAPAFDLCSGCHTNIGDWYKEKFIHQPVADENCEACHAPHGSPNGELLNESIPRLCFGCHDQNQAFKTAHEGYDLGNADCVTCHDPHASPEAKLLMPNQHAPFKSGKCNLCHAGGSGANAFALSGSVKSVCGKCHQGPVKDSEKKYSHNLNDEKSCMNCHNSHASSTTSLLAAPQKVLCMRCHFEGEKYQDKGKEAYITHNGMDCSNCHTPHGSDNPKYLISLDIDLCSNCHVDAHRASHPLGPGIIDKRTNTELTCLSCHKLHGADFEPYLPLDPAMDLCIQCHRK